MKIAAIIVAAGKAVRFGSKTYKSFLMLGPKKVYCYPLEVIKTSGLFEEIFLVCQKEDYPLIKPNHTQYFVEGGDSRRASVFQGLQAVKKSDYVMIFDGCRPFQTLDMIKAHIQKLQQGCIAVNTVIPCEDTINEIHGDAIASIPDRSSLYHGQTPQSFRLDDLFAAHTENMDAVTDDCSLLLKKDQKVDFIFGNKKNLKITTPIDLTIAEALLQKS